MKTEERRIVTILFADVSGFTAMSEALDPEDVRAVMNECFGLLSAEVYRQGGVVDKYIGDNVMALFGLPRAREDDPARAVQAALAMQEALRALSGRLKRERGLSLDMRIGLNTGLVVAGEVGSELKSDYTVMGDAVNLASRIEHHCRPGEVWVSRATYLAARGRFEFEKLAPVAVKGKSRPQAFFRVLRERAAAEETGPFAGRSREMAALKRALGHALRGEFRLVTVSGEAGIGKTRLMAEFLKSEHPRLDARGGRVLRSSAFQHDVAVYSLFAGLGRELGVPPPAEGTQAKAQFFLAMERALIAAARKAPLVLVLEDAHFADDGSWELLAFLIGKLGGSALLLVCLFRPEAQRNVLWSSAGSHAALALGRLSEAETVSVIEDFLGPNRLPRAVKLEIARRADGHAYFLTELLRNLVESEGLRRGPGGWEATEGFHLSAPESVQGVVLARLDRLAAEEKTLLQAASCAGMEFEPGLIDRIEPSLAPSSGRWEPMAARRFVDRRPDGSLAFVHAILRDVCYESLLLARRRACHRRIAEHWEALGEGPQGRNLYRAADHYYWSRDPEPALRLNWLAAQRAESSFAADRSVVFLNRVLETIEAGSGGAGAPAKAQVLFKLGDMYSWLFEPDRSLECYSECLELIHEDDPLGVEAFRKLGVVYNIRGEPRKAEEMFVKAASAAAGRPVTPRVLGLYYEVATAFFRSGRDEEALRWLGRIVEHYRLQGLPLPVPPESDAYALMPAFSHLVQPHGAPAP